MANYIDDMFINVRESKTKEATAINEVIEEAFLEEIDNLDIKALMGMIKEAMDEPSQVNEDAPPVAATSDEEAVEMILKMIPNIEVSEIGWSDVRTPDDSAEIKGPQRKLLEDYLNNIKGTDFADKIASVSQFYTNGVGMVEQQAGADRTKRISQAVSYLVFYKTLTKVITNFNASSAGFSFESFLAALVNGFQIPANTGTIADYVDRASGVEIPVSLKLYKEGKLEVGGSYTDLVRDLVDPKYPGSIGGAMRYVVCTKSLTGEDLEQQGQIDFYQFDFSLDNVMDIIAISKAKSQQCIMLPKQIVSELKTGRVDGVSMADRLPSEQNLPSDEELEKQFIAYLSAILKEKGVELSQLQSEELLQNIDYAKKDDNFKDYTVAVDGQDINRGVVRGRSSFDKDKIRTTLNDFEWLPLRTAAGAKIGEYQLSNIVVAANNAVIKNQSKKRQADERAREIKRMVAEGEFLSPEESAREYKSLGPRQKRVALLNSWGYLTTGHFSLNQKQATNQSAPTNTINIGSIMVGRQMVAKVVNDIREILNDEVAEIFQSLKVLSDSLNSYFAGGLENDSLASTSVQNANNISSKEILQTKE
jgi:hypothetical protein